MANIERVVIGGVDTHKDVHVAAVIDERGKILDVGHFPTTAPGYGELLRWLQGHGQLLRVGIEGTGSYGVGLFQHFASEGVEVVEVNRQNRQNRRRRGKSDPVDTDAAARAALNGEASGTPKSQDGVVESIRALRVAFTSARDTRTRVALQIRDLLVNAPAAYAWRLSHFRPNTAWRAALGSGPAILSIHVRRRSYRCARWHADSSH